MTVDLDVWIDRTRDLPPRQQVRAIEVRCATAGHILLTAHPWPVRQPTSVIIWIRQLDSTTAAAHGTARVHRVDLADADGWQRSVRGRLRCSCGATIMEPARLQNEIYAWLAERRREPGYVPPRVVTTPNMP